MAFGDNKHDDELRSAWHDFCERLKEVGESVFEDPAPAEDIDRASGFQYIARNIATGLDIELEYADPLFPQLFRFFTPNRKWGGDNPDGLYLRAAIDGSHSYRIVGTRGSAHFVAFSAHRPAELVPPGESAEVGRILGTELKQEWDGSFVVTLSPEPHPGNWIRTVPGVDTLWIRQFFGNWERERPMTVRLERIGEEGPPPRQTPQAVINGLGAAVTTLGSQVSFWRDWQNRYRDQSNNFIASATAKQLGAAPGGIPMHCYFIVQPDEALIIEFTPPDDAFYWNFELNNFWMASIDYRYHLSSINGTQAAFEADGSVRIVVSHEDPGIPNWLATDGHTQGHLGLRWLQTDNLPVPETRLIKLAELSSTIPTDARRISSEDRAKQLRSRRAGVDARYRW